MTRRAKKAEPTTATREAHVLEVPGKSEDREQLLADLTTEGVVTNAVLLQSFSKNVVGAIGLTETVISLRSNIKEIEGGNLRSAEAILIAQAGALNAMFSELARRAALNMGEHLSATEAYMRLALKAQGQCRATLETLATIKNPPVVFARQANINNGGQQQVNNGPAPATGAVRAGAPAHAGKPKTDQTELLEVSDGEWLDTGTADTAGRADPHLAPMGAIDRAANGGRQGHGGAQR